MHRRASQQKLMRALFYTLGVLIVMLIVVLVFIVTGSGSKEQQVAVAVKQAQFVQGVTVAGVDVAGLKFEEAEGSDQIAAQAEQAAANFKYTFTVQEKEYTYTAADLGLKSDIKKTLTDAIQWGNTGDDKESQIEEAANNGKDFPIEFIADKDTIESFIKQHKSEYDKLPKNATIKYTDSSASPPFEFVNEEVGADVDAAKLAGIIADNINSGNYDTVEAPILQLAPTLDVKTLKENMSTEPIATFQSSFKSGHLGKKERVNNVKLMGGFVNGTVIEPGETFSVNDKAGPRTADTAKTVGWTKAPGLADGRSTDQYGGGVCQISSTTYNAAIRAELDIVERWPHSWPSDYIKKGMDATVTTGLKDLKIANPYNYPVLITCIVDTTQKTATVNIYGPPMKYKVEFQDAQKVADKLPGKDEYHYNVSQTPDGQLIPAGSYVEWVKPKHYLVYNVYKRHLDSNNNPVDNWQLFSTTTYDAYPGEYYCNGSDLNDMTLYVLPD